MFNDKHPEVPAIEISTCSRQGTVHYTKWLHSAVCRMVENGGGSFEKWIHAQLIQYAGPFEYNRL